MPSSGDFPLMVELARSTTLFKDLMQLLMEAKVPNNCGGGVPSEDRDGSGGSKRKDLHHTSGMQELARNQSVRLRSVMSMGVQDEESVQGAEVLDVHNLLWGVVKVGGTWGREEGGQGK